MSVQPASRSGAEGSPARSGHSAGASNGMDAFGFTQEHQIYLAFWVPWLSFWALGRTCAESLKKFAGKTTLEHVRSSSVLRAAQRGLDPRYERRLNANGLVAVAGANSGRPEAVAA